MVPASWKDVTIRQFIEVSAVLSSEYPDPLDRQIALVSAVTGLSEEQVQNIPIPKLLKAIKSLSFLSDLTQINKKFPKWFVIRGRIFKPITGKKNLTAGQYIDLSSFSSDPMNNLHKMLATLCLPVKWLKVQRYNGKKHEELSEFFYENLTMDIAYPIALFFCNVWEKSLPDILTYLETEIESLKNLTPEQIQNLKISSLNGSDGYTQSMSWPEAMYLNGIESSKET